MKWGGYWRAALHAVCSYAWIAGCSSGSTRVDAQDFSKAFADAACSTSKSCCGERGYMASREKCVAFVKAMAGSSEPGFEYDAAAGKKCLALVKADAASCYPSAGGEDPCEHVFIGTRPNGAACDSNIECAP